MFRLIVAICVLCGFTINVPFAFTIAVGRTSLWTGIAALTFYTLFAIACGLLYLEAFLAVPEANHIVSLSKRLTGRLGSYITSFFYVTFNYGLFIFVYGTLLAALPELFPGHSVYFSHAAIALFILLSAICISLGPKISLPTAALFFLGYLAFLVYAFFTAKSLPNLRIQRVPSSYYTIFLFGVTYFYFFYQSVFPSVVTFLNRDKKQLIKALWIGLSLSLVVQFTWVWLTLKDAVYKNILILFESDELRTERFSFLDFLPQFRIAVYLMILCILIHEMICFGFSLKDFFEDLRFKKGMRSLLLTVLIFFPAWILSLLIGNQFITFRSILSTICAYIIGCIFPLIAVWQIRYIQGSQVKPILLGGKSMLIAMWLVAGFLFFGLWLYPQKIYW